MYSYPTRLPQTTNREDLQFTVSIFDDDTGLPVNLSGIVFLQNPNGFTGTNWQVTDGQIVTTSTTSLRVPGYPIGNQLTALALTLATGLGILAGDPITITDIGGNATMIGYATGYSPSTGVLTVQIGMQFALEIRGPPQGDNDGFNGFGQDYSPWYDWGGGGPGGSRPLIKALLGAGLSIFDVGYVQVKIPVTLMQHLHTKTYLVAMAVTDSVNVRQVFLGELPVLYGGMSIISQVPTVVTPGGTAYTTETGLTYYTTEGT